MWQRPLFVFCLIVLSCSCVFTQARSVTNSDLETYKEKRLQGERDYRENYQRLGFPSPEELNRRSEQSFKESEELSAKLRAERLERERLETAQRAFSQSAIPYSQYYPVLPDNTIYSGAWFNPFFGRRHFLPGARFTGTRVPVQTGYFAGGHFWPGGLGAPRPPATIIMIGPHHR